MWLLDKLSAYFVKGIAALGVMFALYMLFFVLTIKPGMTLIVITVMLGIFVLGWFMHEVLGW